MVIEKGRFMVIWWPDWFEDIVQRRVGWRRAVRDSFGYWGGPPPLRSRWLGLGPVSVHWYAGTIQ